MTKRKKGYSKKFRKVKVKGYGKNTLHFQGSTSKLKDPSNIPYSSLYYHITKNRKKAGQPRPDKPGKIILPEPQAAVLIIKLFRNDGGPRKIISLVTPPDMVINVPNVRKFVKDNLDNLEDNIEEKFKGRYEDLLNTEKITDYSIKFIY